jgi:2-C-methyl-D-erythritol 4-phosphate cytidylyltransferase/2-C-methyl-D-erythritol 2,4-cyclodiphosphate synthase
LSVAVLVVAAGRGSRFGGPVPKQYRLLNEQPMLRHTLAAFAGHPAIGAVTTAIHPDDQALYAQAAEGLNLLPPVAGGAQRQDSVRLGLESLAAIAPDVVLIHDAARPHISRTLIDRVLATFADATVAGVVPGIPLSDTLKRVDAGAVRETVPRDGLWRVQTPQAFRFTTILAAHRACAGDALTDDAAVAEKAGLSVRVILGDEQNEKITLPRDLKEQNTTFSVSYEPRVGSGFDVHAFCPGESVTLCGVEIPHSACLSGHSDADVALHALTDALYGAIGAGDIGLHFPPSDQRWKDCNSKVFLDHAVALITACGGRIAHVDLTIICEAPKVGPHRQAMTAFLCSALSLDSSRVSVKATTTEKLGFCGRKEGIAAQATATVLRPIP